MFEEKRAVLEPAGALAIAGAEAYCKYYGLKGENVVAITSGANMNFDGLRLVSQLADVGRRHKSVLATFVPENRENFKEFCQLVCQQCNKILFLCAIANSILSVAATGFSETKIILFFMTIILKQILLLVLLSTYFVLAHSVDKNTKFSLKELCHLLMKS